MVKPAYLILGAIPVIAAVLLSVPLLTKVEIPVSAANQSDVIDIEYTKHQLKIVSHGITERAGAQKTEILTIKNDGVLTYYVTEQGYPQPEVRSRLPPEDLNRIKALIKETGFISIPSESFSVFENVTEYQKSNVRVTLNGQINQVHWPDPDVSPDFIPPIITMVEAELDGILEEVRGR